MDEPRIVAQQRFDLLDMTRLKSFVHDAISDVMRKVLGDPHHYDASSGDYFGKRPLLVKNFDINKVGSPSLTLKVDRTWTDSGQSKEACIYDKDGKLLTGLSSVTTRNITVAATPGSTNRWVQVRRVSTDDTPEPRKFYDSATGKYTQSTDTRIIDDWELQESTTSADTDATLRDAGWIDICNFLTNGTDDITIVSANVPTLERPPLTWVTSPPDVDQDLSTVMDRLAGLTQMVRRIRYGKESSSRSWSDDPDTDACFEEGDSLNTAGGGIRFGDHTGGLSDVFLRQINDVLVYGNKTMTNLGSLKQAMFKGVFSESPDPANAKGHMYSTSLGSTTPIAVVKPWDIHTALWKPTADAGVDPWLAGSSSHNCWRIEQNSMNWLIYWSPGGAATSAIIIIPIQVPHGSRLVKAVLSADILVAFPAGLDFVCGVRHKNRHSGSITTLSTYTYNVGSGGIWSATGAGGVDAFTSGDTPKVIDNDPDTGESYYIYGYLDDSSGVAANNYIKLIAAGVNTEIREASHTY